MKETRQRRQMSLNIRPSLRRVLDMDKETLLANYALIVHKASSLSSTQRAFVQQVLQSKLNHKSIQDDEVAGAVAKLGDAIKKGLTQVINDTRTDTDKGSEK